MCSRSKRDHHLLMFTSGTLNFQSPRVPINRNTYLSSYPRVNTKNINIIYVILPAYLSDEMIGYARQHRRHAEVQMLHDILLSSWHTTFRGYLLIE